MAGSLHRRSQPPRHLRLASCPQGRPVGRRCPDPGDAHRGRNGVEDWALLLRSPSAEEHEEREPAGGRRQPNHEVRHISRDGWDGRRPCRRGRLLRGSRPSPPTPLNRSRGGRRRVARAAGAFCRGGCGRGGGRCRRWRRRWRRRLWRRGRRGDNRSWSHDRHRWGAYARQRHRLGARARTARRAKRVAMAAGRQGR